MKPDVEAVSAPVLEFTQAMKPGVEAVSAPVLD